LSLDLSASPLRFLDWIRHEIDLDTYFNTIMSGEESIKNKPHPHPYLEMIRRLDIKPTNTIIIEDSIVGLRSALGAGAHVVALSGSVPRESLKIAHRIVDHLDEISIKFIEVLLLENL